MSRPDLAAVRSSIRARALAGLRSLALALLALGALAAAPPAGASEAEVQVSGSCGGGAEAELRLRADDGLIRVRFRVDSNRPRAAWQVAIVREGRLAWRGRRRGDDGGSLDVARRLRDLPGAERISARAVGPRGVTCIAVATLAA